MLTLSFSAAISSSLSLVITLSCQYDVFILIHASRRGRVDGKRGNRGRGKLGAEERCVRRKKDRRYMKEGVRKEKERHKSKNNRINEG